MKKILAFLLLVSLLAGTAMAQDGFIFGDALPTAPELAARGEFGVGVQTLDLVNPDQVDILNGGVLYDRPLRVEVWYPALIPEGEAELTTYQETLGRSDVPDSFIPFEFQGRALRDAEPDTRQAPYPLVVISHGYPGSRLMFTNLTENLASKGYIVVTIDHTDSTYDNVADFSSTLLNRPLDDIFVMDEMLKFGDGLVDGERIGLIGYSLGGYGVLNVIGGGYNGIGALLAGPTYQARMAATPGYAADPRVKAAVLFAPWGGDLSGVGMANTALWDAEGLAGISIPTFWVAGTQDDVSLYETGILSLFDSAVNSERYLLTYENALHNIVPNPAPPEAVLLRDYERYADPVWKTEHINNVNQHFLTAFLGYYLNGDESYLPYLEVSVENANEGVYAVDEAGEFTADHTYWQGFAPRTANGLALVKPE